MTTDTERGREAELAALADLLDAYGGDPARWPADRRAAAERLIAADPQARRLAAEARALDRVLALAPATGARQPLELGKRILDAARAEHRPAAAGLGRPRPRIESLPLTGAMRWASAGVLAASLVIGVVIGISDTGAPYVADVAAATGLADQTMTLTDLLGDEGELL